MLEMMESSQLSHTLRPIGFIQTIFNKKNATPRQSSICPQSKAILTISKQVFSNGDHSLQGIQQFTHLWIIFYFHANKNKRIHAKVHPPRLNGESCGVFSTRSPHRPNPIGLTLAKLDDVKGNTLYLSGIDILDGSPVVDIKPYIQQYDCPQLFKSLGDTNLTAEKCESTDKKADENAPKWINGDIVPEVLVEFTSRSLSQLSQFHSFDPQNKCNYCLNFLNDFEEAKLAIINLLQADPRSVYRRTKCIDRLYYFTIDTLHITCWFDLDTNIVEVIKIKPFSKDNSTDNKF